MSQINTDINLYNIKYNMHNQICEVVVKLRNISLRYVLTSKRLKINLIHTCIAVL